MTVREARDRYFAENGFSEAAYRDRWVTLYKLGPLPLVVVPNPPSRQRAIALHDLHHVATGYATTFAGESEIGAWEIAAGCGEYTAAWLYNAAAFGFGLIGHPRRTYRAFVRGRHARSLYHHARRDEARAGLLDLTVDELRRELALDRESPPATWRDRAVFLAWVALVASPAALAVAVVLLATR